MQLPGKFWVGAAVREDTAVVIISLQSSIIVRVVVSVIACETTIMIAAAAKLQEICQRLWAWDKTQDIFMPLLCTFMTKELYMILMQEQDWCYMGNIIQSTRDYGNCFPCGNTRQRLVWFRMDSYVTCTDRQKKEWGRGECLQKSKDHVNVPFVNL